MIKFSNNIQGIACGPRCPLYLFLLKKDAAAIANAALPANQVRCRLPNCRPRNKRQPHPGSLVARMLRCWSTRPPVSRQALVFSDISLLAFCLDLTGFPQI